MNKTARPVAFMSIATLLLAFLTMTPRVIAAPVSVSISSVANVHGLFNDGSPVTNGGLDTVGFAYSATLTRTSITWSGSTFTLGAAGTADVVSSATVTLPAGNFANVQLLATGILGNQANQTFVVNYTDGTSTRVVRSLSDWFTPQSYSGESIALKMSYRLTSTGAKDTRTFNLYGYSLPIDATKVVKSLVLPQNRKVVVLAIDLLPVVVAASPTVSPAPGIYNTPQAVALSDTTPGAVIYYTTNGSAPTTASTRYTAPVQISVTTTIKAIAVASGFANSAITTATYTISPTQGTQPVSVSLSSVANVHGLFNDGSAVTGGGLDGLGHAYSATLTGTSINWEGIKFTLGASGVADAVNRSTVTLPAGNYSSVQLLATAVGGNQTNQTFVVNYTDGTSTSIVQSLSDWFTPQHYPGEAIALKMLYRLTATGAKDMRTFYIYGYSLAINAAKVVKSITLPNNVKVVVLSIVLIPATSVVNIVCNPLSFGAVADSKTDNTAAIQNAINSCSSQGGGNVELSVSGTNIYVTGPIALKSHVKLQVDFGVKLQATNDHSKYVFAYLNWVYQPKEALISARNSTDVGIIGAGTIDGAGGQSQPGNGPSWWTQASGENSTNHSLRPYLVEFYQCDHVTVTGVTLQNSPMWTQVFRFSDTITESGTTVTAPGSPNTDGLDLVGATNVVLSGLTIGTGDDSIAIKSGLPKDASDPSGRQAGLPQMATAHVQISNVSITGGHGISIGSELSNGLNDVTIQGVQFTGGLYGIRIKSDRDRGGRIFGITYKDITMTGVSLPLTFFLCYKASIINCPEAAPYLTSQIPPPATEPYVHDITVENLSATGATMQSFIEGLPESCIHNVVLTKVKIQTSAAGMVLRHMTGSFTDVTVTPGSGLPFVVQENVSVSTSGTTPPIPVTLAKSGQTPCASQVVP